MFYIFVIMNKLFEKTNWSLKRVKNGQMGHKAALGHVLWSEISQKISVVKLKSSLAQIDSG